MADTIRTKAELVLLMADNSTGDISPQDIRDFVVSNNVQEVQAESAPAVLDPLTDFFLAFTGCNDLTLTTIAAYGERTLSVANATGADMVINADAGETIEGLSSITVADEAFILLGAEASGTNWLTLFRTDIDAPPDDFCLGYFNESVSITNIIADTYVDVNESLTEGLKSDDFSVIGDELVYSGEDKVFAVDVSAAAGKTMGSIENYTFALSKNGTPQAPTIGIALTNGVKDTLPLQLVVTLSDGDTLKAQVRGEGTSDDLIVTDLSIRTMEIVT